jgi:hypothetical protein
MEADRSMRQQQDQVSRVTGKLEETSVIAPGIFPVPNPLTPSAKIQATGACSMSPALA